MEVVATHLQDQVLMRDDQLERDLFGRSAFNRYYYATFLIVRDALGRMNPKWGAGDLAHANIPEVLDGQVKKALTRGREKARKLKEWALVGQCSQAMVAAKELADMIRTAQYTRTVADYKPDVPIQFAGPRGFSLESVSVLSAKGWPPKAKGFMASIEAAWRQIHD